MEIKKIGVLGAGTMGNGFAQVAAQIGCNVVEIGSGPAKKSK